MQTPVGVAGEIDHRRLRPLVGPVAAWSPDVLIAAQRSHPVQPPGPADAGTSLGSDGRHMVCHPTRRCRARAETVVSSWASASTAHCDRPAGQRRARRDQLAPEPHLSWSPSGSSPLRSAWSLPIVKAPTLIPRLRCAAHATPDRPRQDQPRSATKSLQRGIFTAAAGCGTPRCFGPANLRRIRPPVSRRRTG